MGQRIQIPQMAPRDLYEHIIYKEVERNDFKYRMQQSTIGRIIYTLFCCCYCNNNEELRWKSYKKKLNQYRPDVDHADYYLWKIAAQRVNRMYPWDQIQFQERLVARQQPHYINPPAWIPPQEPERALGQIFDPDYAPAQTMRIVPPKNAYPGALPNMNPAAKNLVPTKNLNPGTLPHVNPAAVMPRYQNAAKVPQPSVTVQPSVNLAPPMQLKNDAPVNPRPASVQPPAKQAVPVQNLTPVQSAWNIQSTMKSSRKQDATPRPTSASLQPKQELKMPTMPQVAGNHRQTSVAPNTKRAYANNYH